MIIQSSNVQFQSSLSRSESTVSGSRISDEPETESQRLSYRSRENTELSLYSEVRQGESLKVFDQQRLARELVRYDQESMGPASQRTLVTARGEADATVQFSRYQYTSEARSSLIVSSGTIALDDGREIDFSLYYSRNRESRLEIEQSLTISARAMTDPLVLNFAADSVALDSDSFFFDLDGDGSDEELARLGAGSGFLVLDRNGNGTVDDGSELFGPQTGQGFAELAAFDSDANRWIDSNDPVFSELRLWVDAGTGKQTLVGLDELGIGAIYLGSTPDDFTLVDEQGQLLGQTKASGLMLMESGEVRTVQEIDLANLQNQPTPVDQLQNVAPEPLVRNAGNVAIAEVLQRLEALQDRQTQWLADIRTQTRQQPVVKSPLDLLLEKLEAIREELKKALELQKADMAVGKESYDGEQLTRKLVGLDDYKGR